MNGFAWDGQISNVVPIGVTPAGLRLDVSFTAELTEGELAGAQLHGVDYLLLRPDGVGVIDARELITTTGGQAVHAHATGYIVPPFEMPPLSALIQPDFTWPDADLPMHGAILLESGESSSALIARFSPLPVRSTSAGANSVSLPARLGRAANI